MGEADDARRRVESARERMTEIADELARRASIPNLKSRAREKAMQKTIEIREKAVGAPWFWRVVGASAGAMAASAFGKWMAQRRIDQEGGRYALVPVSPVHEPPMIGAGYEAGGGAGQAEGFAEGGIKERASSAIDTAKEKVSGVTTAAKEKVSGVTSGVRESASHVKAKVQSARGRAGGAFRDAIDESPLAVALGVMAFGLVVSALIPVFEPERRLMRPLKEKATEQVRGLSEQVTGKLEAVAETQPNVGRVEEIMQHSIH